MTGPPAPNWILKLALVVMSAALAALGILGWAHQAGAFDTLAAGSIREIAAGLSPLWPFCLIGAIACIAAQVLAACGVVNFARLKDAHRLWHGLALGLYAIGAAFAAYSADKGATVILGAAHRAAFEQRETERARLSAEILRLSAIIEHERARLPDPATTPTSRQAEARATFEAATALEHARLPRAQSEFEAMPALPAQRPASGGDGWIFLIFLSWGLIEPWGYALAERGRVAPIKASAELSNVVSLKRERRIGNGMRAVGAGVAASAAIPALAGVTGAAFVADVPETPPARISTLAETAQPKAVTLELVIRTANRLAERGEIVSLQRIADAIGGTSKATVHRRLREERIDIAERWPKPARLQLARAS